MEKISTKRIAQNVILTLKVEKLDSLVAPELKATIIHLLSEAVKNIVLDISVVKFCDSSGLGAILLGTRNCQVVGGKFIICGLSDSVRHLISISKLDSTVHIENSVQDSLEKFFL